MRTPKYIGTVLTVGGVIAALVTCLTFWSVYGWITRTAYAEDHQAESVEVTQTAILDALKGIKETQDRNRDQWECDETDEEIEDLQLDLLKTLTDRERVGVNRDLKKQQDQFKKLDCDRFTD